MGKPRYASSMSDLKNILSMGVKRRFGGGKVKERFQSEKEPVDITAVRVAQIRRMKLPLKTRDREKLTKNLKYLVSVSA